jgi:hypothetical protein
MPESSSSDNQLTPTWWPIVPSQRSHIITNNYDINQSNTPSNNITNTQPLSNQSHSHDASSNHLTELITLPNNNNQSISNILSLPHVAALSITESLVTQSNSTNAPPANATEPLICITTKTDVDYYLVQSDTESHNILSTVPLQSSPNLAFSTDRAMDSHYINFNLAFHHKERRHTSQSPLSGRPSKQQSY